MSHGILHPHQETQLIGIGQSCLWLIEDVQATISEPVHDQGDEALPVRLFMQAPSTIAAEHSTVYPLKPVHFRSHIIETLGTEEKGVSVAQVCTYGSQILIQTGMGFPCTEVKVTASPLRIKPEDGGNSFEQG